LDAETYSSTQQKIYGKSVKGSGGTLATIILALVFLSLAAEAVFSIGKYLSGECAFDALVKRMLFCVVGVLISLTVAVQLI